MSKRFELVNFLNAHDKFRDNENKNDLDSFDVVEILNHYDKTLTEFIKKEVGQQNKIAELEEQLKNAIKLPVKLGDKIYVVPSKTNFEINNIHHKERNRVYEWEVHEIRFNKYGYDVVSWTDNTPYFCADCETIKIKTACESQRFYRETWFKTKEEALAKLKELQGE